ncbi:MAG: diadenylate cyclase [Candidatus Latescibacteria bacterium]|nr:diadenylate cyclase [Candidatus Latescibacterota bacterium]
MPQKRKRSYSTAVLELAATLSQDVGADLVLLVADAGVRRSSVEALNEVCRTLVLTRSRRFLKGIEEAGVQRLHFESGLDNTVQLDRVRQGVALGVEAGYIRSGSRVVCLTGVADRKGVDTVVVLEARKWMEGFHPETVAELAGDLQVEVVRTVLDLALEIGEEGREGEVVGTLFVIGDAERVMANSRPMTFDPFRGYSEREKNICNPDIREGVKEVALMDGAFIVQEGGVILSGGRYITADVRGLSLPKGLGARHVAAAAITRHTKSVAVAVSESTGIVRAFRNGEIVLRKIPARRYSR